MGARACKGVLKAPVCISKTETWVPKRGGLKPAGKRQESAAFLHAVFSMLQCSFSFVAAQLLVQMTSALQTSECCSAVSAAQLPRIAAQLLFFAGGMLQGWGLEGWGFQARKTNPNLNFWARIFSGGVGVFHTKGWGPKSSVCPLKPGKSNFFGGISRDFAGILRGCPKSLRKKRLGSIFVPYPKDPSVLKTLRRSIP